MALSTNNRRPFNIACHRTVQPAEFHCRRQRPFYVQGAVSCKLLQGEYKGYLSTPGRRKKAAPGRSMSGNATNPTGETWSKRYEVVRRSSSFSSQ
jgi:hypothetical protein